MEMPSFVTNKETITLPKPKCTYADHSYPAYTERQVKELLESLGYRVKTLNDLGEDV